MNTKRMLIDATHPEETRVVVLKGNQIENFDVEVDSRRQLKSNIYLAKVTRVEPSLQAAFIEYGGNRHGFLAFNEIHPDYYQIPVADREALLAEQAQDKIEGNLVVDAEISAEQKQNAPDASDTDEASGDSRVDFATFETISYGGPDAEGSENETGLESIAANHDTGYVATSKETGAKPETLETLADHDSGEEQVRRSTMPSHRKYKIQEVIKRRQILLIQVVKEERGNKGAALTTYISLAGRYCVLMPNTARGGGISRKITNIVDRKRLKSIVNSLGIPEGMAVIMRTAGIKQTKPQIKRDYDYLLRLWGTVRELTLKSIAPTLVYEEGNLIKRSIRDLYSKDIDEIIVAGDASYRMAKDFMKMFIPSHAKRVQPYNDSIMPLMHRYQVEGQLDAMHNPEVQLKSGGYIVINPTEALVAIDVNSGRSTKERNIEETAYKTNLEAAEEIARQLRLRDLAGLIVIDFIDMEINKNNAQVERRLNDFMRSDRARIQIGRISSFGLLELSRQRLRPSIIESTSEVCLHCEGTGVRRSTESTALNILRAIEEEGTRKRLGAITVYVPTSVALYILNQKRQMLAEIEVRYEFSVALESDDTLIPPHHRIARTEDGVERPNIQPEKRSQQSTQRALPTEDAEHTLPTSDEASPKRRRRGRRRRKTNQETGVEVTNTNTEISATSEGAIPSSEEASSNNNEVASLSSEQVEEAPKRRRRGRRGGRKRRPVDEDINATPVILADEDLLDSKISKPAGEAPEKIPQSDKASSPSVNDDRTEKKPPRRRRQTRKKANDGLVDTPAPSPIAVPDTPINAAPGDRKNPPKIKNVVADANIVNVAGKEAKNGGEDSAPPRRGWWQRLIE
jgi:ribonuclease E